jgi:phosphoenolpyruvate synthase/pyruvate phosphate dikinase
MHELILQLADRGAMLANVGGKGASLARLADAGLPVPGGFHVTTGAYARFVADNDLQPGSGSTWMWTPARSSWSSIAARESRPSPD